MKERVRPVVIIEPGAMSKRDISRMNKAGITVVEAKNPPAIRFLDPPPYDRDDQERAAISLCRVLLTQGATNTQYYRSTIAEMYVKLLMEGHPLEARAVEPVKAVAPAPKR